MGKSANLTVDRRVTALGLALLLSATGAAAAEVSADKAHDGAGQAIEGTWVLTVQPPLGAPAFLATASYMRGGVVIVSPDRLPPVPGLGSVVGAGQGSWRATGPREFVATHVEFRYGTAGEVVGTAKLRSILRLRHDDAVEGTGQLLLCDEKLDDCQPFGSALATFSGVRLPAEAPVRP